MKLIYREVWTGLSFVKRCGLDYGQAFHNFNNLFRFITLKIDNSDVEYPLPLQPVRFTFYPSDQSHQSLVTEKRIN